MGWVGFVPTFCLWGRMLGDFAERLSMTVAGLGFQLVDWERGGRGLMRVFIDSRNGVTVDDCVLVSNHLSRWFAVEGVDYDRLEVSSPGLDRPLRRPADFARFAGQKARISLLRPVAGQRRFVGILRDATDTEVTLDGDGGIHRFAYADIDKARLVPEF